MNDISPIKQFALARAASEEPQQGLLSDLTRIIRSKTGLPSATSEGRGDGIHDDAKALADWLGFVSLRNLETTRSYRKEVMRFRMFLETIHAGQTDRQERFLLRDATEMDVLLYEAHLAGRLRTGEIVAPLIVPAHILSKYGKRTDDQPFIQFAGEKGDALREIKPLALKASSINQALSILHALYQRWLQPDPQTKTAYVGANPVKRVKGASNRMQRQINRNFSVQAMQAMLTAAKTRMEQMASTNTEHERVVVARQRWIAAMLFGLWGRRAEVARICMNDFVHDGVRWTVHLMRKGGKSQVLPVAPWVMNELMQYRLAMGLPPLPSSEENFPCIQRLGSGSNARYSSQMPVHPDLIYRDVESLCKTTADMLGEAQVLPEISDVDRQTLVIQLRAISPHWFRHSGASIAINSGAMSLENASKMLGHSSPVVTAEMYYHPSEGQITEGIEKLGALALN